MKWTTEKPTEPGWYWLLDNLGRRVVVEVAPMRRSLVPPGRCGLEVWFDDEAVLMEDISDRSRWSDRPIPEPKEEG